MKKKTEIEQKSVNEQTIRTSDRHVFTTYSRYPITIAKGKGMTVWDTEGKKYLDFVSGLAVNNLGHCHPEIVASIKKQAATLLHTSNLYYTVPQTELARKLTSCSFADRVFFCNSGAEANEAAIKLCRKYSADKFGKGRYEIITMERSFHGRTMATLSATGQEKFHKGYTPLLSGFKYVPFNDINSLKNSITGKTCAIMLEPIQGEGGVNLPSEGYLGEVRDLCYSKDILLVFDEVQTGMGRTGKMFAYDHFDIKPDIMTLAKGLGAGFPIGAMLARENVALAFEPGSHASTFGGNPLAAAVSLTSLGLINRSLLSNCTNTARFLIKKLNVLKSKYSFIKDVRGLGLMIGMELDIPGGEIVWKLMEKGFLINCTMNNILRFLPPLIVEKKQIEALITALDKTFSEVERE